MRDLFQHGFGVKSMREGMPPASKTMCQNLLETKRDRLHSIARKPSKKFQSAKTGRKKELNTWL